MDFSSHSFRKFTISISGLLLFSPISCTRSSPVLFSPFFPPTRFEIYLTTSFSPLDLHHLCLIIELTSSAVDFGIIFNVYFTRTFLLNATKEKRLLSRASPICTVQFTALPNMGARQIERHAFSHLFVNKSSWQASNTNTRVLFPVPVQCAL